MVEDSEQVVDLVRVVCAFVEAQHARLFQEWRAASGVQPGPYLTPAPEVTFPQQLSVSYPAHTVRHLIPMHGRKGTA